jgi:hypothetical protein
VSRVNTRRLEVVLPAETPARDYAAVTHAIWAVLEAAGLDEDGALTAGEAVPGADEDARPGDDR